MCACWVRFRDSRFQGGSAGGCWHAVNQHIQSSTHAHTTPNQTQCRHAVLAKLDYARVVCVRQQMVICLPVYMWKTELIRKMSPTVNDERWVWQILTALTNISRGCSVLACVSVHPSSSVCNSLYYLSLLSMSIPVCESVYSVSIFTHTNAYSLLIVSPAVKTTNITLERRLCQTQVRSDWVPSSHHRKTFFLFSTGFD